MLEIKNLTKIYKTKVGADVRALDDVSITFPEKGMVFLLGKSGSGKSTLAKVLLKEKELDFLNADEIAKKYDTISYEVLCSVAKRAKKIYLR